jgi:hypothetical protein
MLTTIAKVKSELRSQNASNVAGFDQVLFGYINKVTQRVKQMGYTFEPFYGTQYFTARPELINQGAGTLDLRNRRGQQLLLASDTDVPTINSNNQSLAYGSTIVSDPRNYTPIRTLRFADNSCNCQTWYPYGLHDTIAITGWWGYRDDYATDGWVDSGDSLTADINETVTTLAVNNVDGEDAFFGTPRFSGGALIRIGNEVMLVIQTDTVGETLGVRRRQNGTSAATHTSGSTISIWYPQPDIAEEATRQAALQVARRGAFDEITVSDVGSTVYPHDLLAQLVNALQGYNNQ